MVPGSQPSGTPQTEDILETVRAVFFSLPRQISKSISTTAMNCCGGALTLPYILPLHHLPNPNPNHSLKFSTSSSPFLSSSNSPKITIPGNFNRLRNRRNRSSKDACFSDLPLLPFQSEEVLVPSEMKTLHLYESRFLALLEEALVSKKLFVHFVLEPVLTSGSSLGASFAARYGSLVLIENVERLEIGALVSIRGIGRVSIVKFVQMEPYLRGVVIPLQDNIPDSPIKINSTVMELSEALYSLNSLQIKLKASKDELLQTPLANSLRWAEKERIVDCDIAFIPSLAERVSFAALQPVSGMTRSELLALQREKLQAMDLKDRPERLANSLQLVKQQIAVVAAKLAIQSLEA
ncbi:uncharacterized protein LOC131236616 isoform X1 [Magnolia sinica]|uniref:uncharacterized protein LOC131236616 isoform X1 n=1 Tax=Magnolia sinica TaxID=86752 RepID=UPI002659746A|nr:uncharacterized protein LOC131236616 isoform X1 [Magnolia sinica]